MRANNNLKTRVIVALLTIVAAWQSACATNKTVTYTMTSTETDAYNVITVVFTRSGDAPFDTSAPTTFTTTIQGSALSTSGGAGNFYLDLADDFSLRGSWTSGSNVLFTGNNLVSASTQGITYTLRCSNTSYYVTHVAMGINGGTEMITDTDYDDELNFNQQYKSAYTRFGKLSITYSDAPHHAPEDIPGICYNGDEGYYEIPDADALNALSTYVNNVNDCAGLTFMMTADIAFPYTTAWNDESSTENNYTPIGNINTSFSGTFDGGGHTVSGIRIYNDYSSYKGIIGNGVNCTVQNVILADTRISGYNRIGGIVGCIREGVVSNCHSTATVAFHVVKNGANSIGGIVGNIDHYFKYTSSVSDCTSAAVFTLAANVDASTCGSFGGIVGRNINGTISDCTSAGVILPNIPAYGGSGAIVGWNNNGGILSGNTYHSCLMGGTYAFNIGAGENYTSETTYNAGDVSGISLDRNKLFLYDDRNNTALINAYSKTYNSDESTAYSGTRPNVRNLTVTLKGRTLYKDGNWNTLCLPFSISSINSLPSSLKTGVSIMELDKSTGFDSASGTLNLNFNSVNSITRGKPFLIKWTSGDDVIDPIFTSVDGSRMSASTTTVTSNDGNVSLRGTYAPVNIYTDERTRLYLGNDNTIYYPLEEDFTLNAFRAYFQLNNVLTSQQAGVHAIVLNFRDGEETGITETDYLNDGAWYSLDGRKLSGKPTQGGVYINNGMKVVVY